MANGRSLTRLFTRSRRRDHSRIDLEGAGAACFLLKKLSWRYTDPRTVLADGLIPFFIDWGQSPHPARTAAPGASLIALRAEHPNWQRVQRRLRELGLDLPVQPGATPALVATIDGPRGRVELR